jgi:hypothetical protein
MATHATPADVDALKALYAALIDDMTYDASASVLAIYQQQATNSLNLWADSELAVQNLNAAAASSYSSSVGTSVTKRELEDAMSAASTNLEDFGNALLLGGVTLPTAEVTVSLWDMSGNQYAY